MKTVPYSTALARFRKHCERTYGRKTKTGGVTGVATGAGAAYGITGGTMSEILRQGRDKRMSAEMLESIGLRYENVIVRVEK